MIGGLSAVRVNATSLAVTRARPVVILSSEGIPLDWNTQFEHDPHDTTDTKNSSEGICRSNMAFEFDNYWLLII